MDLQSILLTLAAAAVLVGAGYLFGHLKKVGVNTQGILNTATSVVGTLDSAFDALKPLLPNNPAVPILDAIFGTAKWGVNQAEQLYKTSQIGKEERKDEATKFIKESLAIAGIEITPELEKVIEGAVEGATALLPRTHDENGEIVK